MDSNETVNEVPERGDLSSFSLEEIENWFTYHPPTLAQMVAYGRIRTAAKSFAVTLNCVVPAGADKSAAFRLLREAVMTANAGIACHVVKQRPAIAELEEILGSQNDKPITIGPDGSVSVDEV